MLRIAVLALTEHEHQHLIGVWKFFPFSEDVAFHYLYLGSDDSAFLSQSASLHAVAFSTAIPTAITDIRTYLEKEDITLYCFAGRDSFELWARTLNLSSLTHYKGKKHNIVDIGGYPGFTAEKASEFAQSHGLKLALLKSEQGQLDLRGDTIIYDSYHSYSLYSNGEALLTGNSDLLSAVCANDPVAFTATHILDDFSALDLGVSREKADINLSISLLKQLAQSADKPQADLQNIESTAQKVLGSYSFFADYYDNYMSHVDYDDWLALMLGWYKQHSKQPMKKVLEIACGTANASEILVFRGYEVDACDSSPLMLHYADAKVFKPNLFYGSMTDSLPRKEYDFAFCLFDSINYLTHKNDIKTLFKNVSLALRPGGIFIFDISTLFNSLQNFNETIHFTRVKDGYMIHDSRFEVLSNRQITHFTLFRKHGSVYHKLEEHHVQRVYRCPELVEMIAASPLNLKAIHVPELRANLLPKLGTDLDNRHHRIFFVLQKPE